MKGKTQKKATKQPAKETKALAKVGSKAVSTEVVDIRDRYAQQQGAGMQRMQQEDLGIPFLAVIQANSPQLLKNDAKFIKGAKAGDIFNTVTNEVWEEVDFVPCFFEKKFVEWRPRNAGGGFVMAHDRAAPVVVNTPPNEKGRRVLKNGHDIIETAYYYGLIVDDNDECQPAVIGMASTQLKKSRRWNTTMATRKLSGTAGQEFTPPTYAYAYTLRTASESNEKGSWYGWDIEMEGHLVENESVYQAAVSASNTFGKDTPAPAYSTMDSGTVDAEGADSDNF